MQQLRCVHVKVTGRVQGVFFREYTRRKAVDLGLSGWVKNCIDASVEAEFAGAANRIDEMLTWLQTGSPQSEVAGVRVSEQELPACLEGFSIVF